MDWISSVTAHYIKYTICKFLYPTYTKDTNHWLHRTRLQCYFHWYCADVFLQAGSGLQLRTDYWHRKLVNTSGSLGLELAQGYLSHCCGALGIGP